MFIVFVCIIGLFFGGEFGKFVGKGGMVRMEWIESVVMGGFGMRWVFWIGFGFRRGGYVECGFVIFSKGRRR